ncbi:GDSL-type esterase/lipase family protein [Eubacteriales bacterium OttesenSCG-928-G02]|nr:GDSL-type esterase/lipase family protein [Eubacteriales bacterium OttesenSCG-928-G02]
MNLYQRIMYITISLTTACAIITANYVIGDIFIPIESNAKTNTFINDFNDNNETLLKNIFPYETVDYQLSVPDNMTYTNSEFQQFKGTYLEASTTPYPTSYLKETLFAGDSLTYHLGYSSNQPLHNYDVVAQGGLSVYDYATYNKNIMYNQSPESKTSTQFKTSIQWISELKPDIIYIMLGTNGIGTSTTISSYIKSYEILLNKIENASPNSEIVICAITPVNNNTIGNYKFSMTVSELNTKIMHYNMSLLETAKKRGYYFLNGAEIFYDANGMLLNEYASADGLHWSNKGRSRYIDYVLAHPVPGF